MYITYVLRSLKNKTYYYGQTSDLAQRLINHNSGLSKYTKRGIPWELIYIEDFETRSDALKREKYFKSYNGYKYLLEKGVIHKQVDKTNLELTKPSYPSGIKR